MKNRILSFVLALVMVLALVPVAAIGSSAEATKDITITAGQVTVAPGGTAYVPVYAELSTIDYQGISNFQIVFDLPEGAALTTGNTFFPTAGSASAYFNVATETVGASADSAYNGLLGTTSALTAKGGALIAIVAVAVDATVAEGTVLPVVATSLVEMEFCSYEGATKTADKDAFKGYTTEFVAGSITVATVAEGAADANEDEVDYYAIPEVNAAGEKVTSISKANAQAGTYGTLYVPASIVEVAKKSCTGEVTTALIFKNTDAFDGYDIIADMAESATIYYHKLANGGDTMYDTIVEDGYENTLVNILGGGATVDGNDLTVYGTIRVDDLAYENVTVEVVIGDRTFEADFNCVYTTLTHNGKAVVSTNAGAVELGATDGEGVYVFGLTITGVDAGTYDVVVNVYGTTAASNGSPVVVCNDATTVNVTIA